MNELPVVAIDGPAGAGKSTLAQAVAERLGFVCLDSGALYRTVAYVADEQGLTASGAERVDAILPSLAIDVRLEAGQFRVFHEQSEITARLRDPGVTELASTLATRPAVRAWVQTQLRRLARRGGCVAEGRDMGTTVFPDARLKVYLEAPLAVRAARRAAQYGGPLAATGGEAVAADLARRDARDQERSVSPLRVAPGAVRIDNSHLTPAQQADLVACLYRGGGHVRGPLAYRVVKWLAVRLLKLCFAPRVRGREHLPSGPFILAANHISYLDPPLLALAAPGRIGYLAKAELFRFWPIGAFLRLLAAIPLRRGRFDKGALAGALLRLRRGECVAIFPQGTRQRSPAPAQAHRGVALLARRAQVPVVPLAVRGTDDWRSALRRRPRIELEIGAALDPPAADASPREDPAYARAVLARILERTAPRSS